MAGRNKKNLVKIDIAVIDRARQQLAVVERLKQELAAKRDELRTAYHEMEGICESLTRGVEEITSGLRQVDRGLDSCSEYV